jgi:hypothetical protein
VTRQPTPPSLEARGRQDSVEQALYEIKRVIAGQDTLIERVLVCLLAEGTC